MCGYQMQVVGRGELDRGNKKVQTFSYEISLGDGMYSMATLVNDIALYT